MRKVDLAVNKVKSAQDHFIGPESLMLYTKSEDHQTADFGEDF